MPKEMCSLCGDQGCFSQQCVHKFYPECISWAESQGFNIPGSKPAVCWEGFIWSPHTPLCWSTSNWSAKPFAYIHPGLPHAQTYWHVSEEAYTTSRYSSPKGHQHFCHTHPNSEFQSSQQPVLLEHSSFLPAPNNCWSVLSCHFHSS